MTEAGFKRPPDCPENPFCPLTNEVLKEILAASYKDGVEEGVTRALARVGLDHPEAGEEIRKMRLVTKAYDVVTDAALSGASHLFLKAVRWIFYLTAAFVIYVLFGKEILIKLGARMVAG